MSPSAPAFLDGSVERAEVTDLYPWMEYQFRIIATNEYGSGEASIPSLKIKTWDARKEKDGGAIFTISDDSNNARTGDASNPLSISSI